MMFLMPSRPLSSTTFGGFCLTSGRKLILCTRGIWDTDFDKYTEDAVALFTKLGLNTTFENLEGFPGRLENERTSVR